MAKPCSFPGCDRDTSKGANGLCGAHRLQMKTSGVLKPIRVRTALDWLRAHVAHDGDACLTWPYSLDKKTGHGSVNVNRKIEDPSRLMCRLAHGEPPTSKHEAAHSCGKGHEGCVNPRHLSWKTHTENMADCLIHGTRALGERHGLAKLTEGQVVAIREFAHTMKQKSIAEMFGVSDGAIYSIVHRENWRHV